MAEEWGPWIEHDGGPCPVPKGTWVIGQFRSGDVQAWQALTMGLVGGVSLWEWRGYIALPRDVMRYRIRRPDALRRLIDLAADPDRGLPPPFPVEELA